MAFKHGWFLAAGMMGALASAGAGAQTVTGLTNPIPYDGTVYGFLMTDGSILFQGGLLIDWYKFTPDQNGSYLNGTWSDVTGLPADYVPYATSGGVLPDGRLLLIGGEYLYEAINHNSADLIFELTGKSAIYDPLKDSWRVIAPPAGWGFIGDSPWTILANGKLLLGQKTTKLGAEFDPKALAWKPVTFAGKADFNAEEGWTLMRDGSVLTVDVKNHPATERFIPGSTLTNGHWQSAGATPTDLRASLTRADASIPYDNGKKVYHPPGEVGPAILRPDGTVFATGAVCADASTGSSGCTTVTKVGHTAVYHPGQKSGDTGSWTAGPDFPGGVAAGDSYAVLLPSGNVLVEANPAGTVPDGAAERYAKIKARLIKPLIARPGAPAATEPTWNFFEFDGKKLISKANVVSFTGGAASLLLLPTGEVMMNGQAIYAPSGKSNPAWAPTVTAFPATVKKSQSYTISGTQFNGLSQANAFGDEMTVATNYPLVRITNDATHHVTYARTHDHSSMGVATGTATVSTHFDVPDSVETGKSHLEVVANGIASTPVAITVQ